MMRKLLALPFESVHLFGTAFFFGLAGVLALLTSPSVYGRISTMSESGAARRFQEVVALTGPDLLWIAGASVVGALVAPYARGDARKALAWLRVLCALATLVLVVAVWGKLSGIPNAIDPAARSDAGPTFWNGLLLATGLDLALTAAAITGGAAKAATPAQGGK
jgi:hypothetical protein